MKKSAIALLAAMIFVSSLAAETPAIHEAAAANYLVFSEISGKHAADTGKTLDALFDLFNSVFHFERETLKGKLRVRILADKKRYDEYLGRIIGQSRNDFIYLHYSDPEKSELVGYAAEAELFQESLNHQAFIQFLRSFVPNPPLWMREGFAVFFEKTSYDPAAAAAVYKENLAWLDTLKGIVEKSGGKDLIPLAEILKITQDEARGKIDVFYPQAWGIVSFLMYSPNGDHRRILWDAVSALDPAADLAKNAAEVNRKAVKWYEEKRLTEDFLAYLAARKSFRTLVQEGIDNYSKSRLDRAEESFVSAAEMDDGNYIPYYYLGLINYSKKSYSVAEHFYKLALENGAQPALVYYAMGVNAFAENRAEDARNFLNLCKDLDPSYKEKAEDLLKRLQK